MIVENCWTIVVRLLHDFKTIVERLLYDC